MTQLQLRIDQSLAAAHLERTEQVRDLVTTALYNMGLRRETRVGEQWVRFREAYALHDGERTAYLLEVDALRLPIGVRLNDIRHPTVLEQLGAIVTNHLMPAQVYALPGLDIDLGDGNGQPHKVHIGFSLAVLPGSGDSAEAALQLPGQLPFTLADQPDGPYMVPIGATVWRGGEIARLWFPLPKLGHIIIAAMSGAGKSNVLRAIFCTLQLTETPETLQLALIDAKKVEFAPWRDSPFLLDKIANNLNEATALASKVGREVERRLDLFAAHGVFDLEGFNAKFPNKRLPRIVFAIDEMKDLAMRGTRRSSFYSTLIQGASKWRAAGVTNIIATTDPRADTIDPSIMSNSGCKIVGHLARSVSIAFIGNAEAERLPLAQEQAGRFLAQLPGIRGTRVIQAYHIRDEDFLAIADHVCGRESGPLLEQTVDEQGRAVLADDERLVLDVVLGKLEGRFTVRTIYDALGGRMVNGQRITDDRVSEIGRLWERNGWLVRKPGPNSAPRIVTSQLFDDLGLELPAFMSTRKA